MASPSVRAVARGPDPSFPIRLGIVEADPIKYNLLFERFLNPERQSMPDIDVDFSDVHREEVVQYLQRKYGSNRVGHVLTTQTIGAKEALRDIGRVYHYEDREIDLIGGTIVDDKLSLRDDYRRSPQFKKLIDSDPYYLGIVALASKIEGLPRQAGLARRRHRPQR
jgi:DNA polymerase-3 subunit alpha